MHNVTADVAKPMKVEIGAVQTEKSGNSKENSFGVGTTPSKTRTNTA